MLAGSGRVVMSGSGPVELPLGGRQGFGFRPFAQRSSFEFVNSG